MSETNQKGEFPTSAYLSLQKTERTSLDKNRAERGAQGVLRKGLPRKTVATASLCAGILDPQHFREAGNCTDTTPQRTA